jgi:hypothetical protein
MRTFPVITSQEGLIYQAWCRKKNVIADDLSNGEVVANYFQNTWNEDITEPNLNTAFEALRPHLKMDSPARQEAQRLAQGYFDSQALAAWFDEQTLLSKDGDEGHRNFAELISELQLQHLPATDVNIQSAIMSIQHATQGGSVGKFSTRNRRPFVYAQKAKERQKSFHQATDDGKNPFSTSEMVKTSDGGYRSKTPQEQRRDAELAEAAKNPTPKTRGPEDAWETACNELLRFGSHSAQANMRELYERGIERGKSFREIYSEMNKLKASNERLLPTAKY